MTVDEHLLVAEQFPVNEHLLVHTYRPDDGAPAAEADQVPLSEQLQPVEETPPEELTAKQLPVHEQLPSANIDKESNLVNLCDKSVAIKKVKCVVAGQYSSGDKYLNGETLHCIAVLCIALHITCCWKSGITLESSLCII